MRPATRGRIRRGLGILVALVALGFFIQRLIVNAARMPHIDWHASTFALIVVTVALVALPVVLSAAIWQVLLRDQGVRRSHGTVFSLFFVSQFGKYLPGNVGQFVGRVVMARDAGIPAPLTLTTMVTEVLWNIGTALGIAAIALYVYVGGRVVQLPSWLDATGLTVCVMALLVAPWIGISLARRVFPGLVARLFAGSELRAPGWGAALKVSALYIACYVSMGVAIDFQATGLFGAHSAPWLETSGFFALAWLAGYILPGAPAGIGVRESVMLVLLSPLYGESTAVALGITLRLASTLADALALIVGWASRRSFRRRQNDLEKMTNGKG